MSLLSAWEPRSKIDENLTTTVLGNCHDHIYCWDFPPAMMAALSAWVPGSEPQLYCPCYPMDLPYRVIDPAQSQINVHCAASPALNTLNAHITLPNLYVELRDLAEIFGMERK